MSAVIKNVWSKPIVKYALVFVAGIALGSLITHRLDARRHINPAALNNRANPTNPKQFAQDIKERLESRYKQTQDQIANDVKNKQLTQKQADALKKELAAAYAFRKAIDTTKQDDRLKLQAERKKWRDWSQANNVSYRYFVWLY